MNISDKPEFCPEVEDYNCNITDTDEIKSINNILEINFNKNSNNIYEECDVNDDDESKHNLTSMIDNSDDITDSDEDEDDEDEDDEDEDDEDEDEDEDDEDEEDEKEKEKEEDEDEDEIKDINDIDEKEIKDINDIDEDTPEEKNESTEIIEEDNEDEDEKEKGDEKEKELVTHINTDYSTITLKQLRELVVQQQVGGGVDISKFKRKKLIMLLGNN
jgi:hypothetical protein